MISPANKCNKSVTPVPSFLIHLRQILGHKVTSAIAPRLSTSCSPIVPRAIEIKPVEDPRASNYVTRDTLERREEGALTGGEPNGLLATLQPIKSGAPLAKERGSPPRAVDFAAEKGWLYWLGGRAFLWRDPVDHVPDGWCFGAIWINWRRQNG